MKKIAVIGNAAGGKSTLCRALKAKLNLPLLEIDQIFWTPDWQPAPVGEYNIAHDTFIAGDAWIVDGVGSWPSVLKRLDAADTIIFLDMPLWRHFWWLTKRQLWTRSSSVSWRLTDKLYKMIWQMHHDLRQKIIAELTRQRHAGKVIKVHSLAGMREVILSCTN